jgi:hypothetical protein
MIDGDVQGNYMQIMRDRGWTWSELADDFARQAASTPPPLDGGVGMQRLERWARGEAVAAELRAASSPTGRPEDAPPPIDPKREPPKRTAVPRDPAKRTA